MRSNQKWTKIIIWVIVATMVLSLAVAIIPTLGG
jgi:ABC-type glycerol-3-phosphate transport system permease component